jgi:hypothetical protein
MILVGFLKDTYCLGGTEEISYNFFELYTVKGIYTEFPQFVPYCPCLVTEACLAPLPPSLAKQAARYGWPRRLIRRGPQGTRHVYDLDGFEGISYETPSHTILQIQQVALGVGDPE